MGREVKDGCSAVINPRLMEQDKFSTHLVASAIVTLSREEKCLGF
jgi:hypothetical protein